MEMSFSGDVPDLDEDPRLAIRPDGGVNLRVQPALLLPSGNYRPWRGVAWTVRCGSPEEAIAVRDALRACFEAIGRRGAAAVQHTLETARDGQAVPAAAER